METFEYEYSGGGSPLMKWKNSSGNKVEKNMKDAKDKLESEMEDAYHEHQANLFVR